ncbi:PAS domain S-box-containing protein/diguanylate cyclase (GGDEF) domain-containing protein [Rhodoferax sp. OV413]|uniref:sensor domain-containing protein n=1 Tax=Rhodoferax sp. OV413 TaxID=1855285 RepID=UPI000887B8D0|nr:EAL domain-containing protein [Rhodoferax sp. OV413]SDO13602.1 PAS domain S-box-containing protein/diguanylate cyclase (GGDEF) domain-containing protein [Rhodoferax sp. OV413]
MTDRIDSPASPAPQDWTRAPELSGEDNPWKVALEASGVGVWEWDLASNTQTHSQRWEEILGYRGGELTGGYAEFIHLVHPDDIVPLQAAVTAYLAGLAPDYIADLRMRHKNGHWVWIMSHGTIVSRDAEGRPLRMIGTHTDISARKQAEVELRELNAQLQEQTRLLQTTTASISQGIFVFNAEMCLIAFNQRACEMLDLPESFLAERPSLAGISSFQFKRGDFGPQAQLVDEHARDYVLTGGKTPLPAHFLRDTPDGRTLEVKSQMLPDGGMVRTVAEVSDYVQAQAARKRLDLLLTAMQSQAQVGAWEVDVATDRVYWTEGVYRIFQTSPEEYTPSTAMESAQRVFTPASMEKVHARALAFDTDQAGGIELEAVTFRGNTIWVHVTGTSVRKNGKLVSRIGVMQNITDRKQAQMAVQETEDRWRLALESTGDGVWDWHIQSGVEHLSKRLVEMYGFQEGEMPDLPAELDKRTHPDDLVQMERDRIAHFSGLTSTYSNEHRVRCKDGSWKWVLSRGMVISRDAQGRPARMIGTHTDITERKASEALIRQQAFFDTLTGLPNRRMLRDRLEQEIKRCKRDVQQLAILFIDLDHFKEVNDTLGHDNGDLLLQEAARRIQHCVREADTVARMGGDEFTVILTEVNDGNRLEPTLQKILRTLEAVFQLGNEQAFVSASIGITLYPADAQEIEGLFKNADQALYVAKGAGRNRFSFFTPALQEAAQTRARLAHDLRSGLQEQQFRLVYQPIVELATGSVHKAEALIRWQHPTRGLVSPAHFIPIAESSGLIVDIGEWVFQQAAQQVQTWRQTLHPDFQISVNKSPAQFHHDGHGLQPWASRLQAMGLPGACMVVEITEGLLLDTSTRVTSHLLELGEAGIQVSLDDFGTGYSSLSYLQKFDIDFLKIDQSFVRHLIPGSTDLALCKAIIVMAHALGMKVVAEGVETTQQRDLLTAAGCDYAQGYLFSHPLAAAEFEAYWSAPRLPNGHWEI